jgi:hypothetical protein
MSIATDEAAQKYPAPTDAGDPMYKYVEAIAGYPSAKRQGYVAGRTAEPTEAEIEAAARVFFGNLHYPSASLDWDKAADSVKDNWRRKTRLALTAARKAVTE